MGRLVRLGGSEAMSLCHASVVSSAISTNPRSRIFFTTLCGRTAVGLYGPGVEKLTAGISGVDLTTVGTDVVAACCQQLQRARCGKARGKRRKGREGC